MRDGASRCEQLEDVQPRVVREEEMQKAQGRRCHKDPENPSAKVDGGEPGRKERPSITALVWDRPCSWRGLRKGSPRFSLPLLLPGGSVQAHPPTGVQAAPASPRTHVWCQPHSRAHAVPRAVAGLTPKQPRGVLSSRAFPKHAVFPGGHCLLEAGGRCLPFRGRCPVSHKVAVAGVEIEQTQGCSQTCA